MVGSLQQLARALGGVVSGQQVNAPGPGHSKHDRSLSVFLDPSAPDLFRVHSHAGDDWQRCRDYVKARLGLPPGPAADHHDRVAPRFTRPPADDNDMAARTARARAIWREAVPIEGTAGINYLVKRGVDVAGLPPLQHALRWHPSCPWEDGRHGAMVALLTDALTGEPRAIHRTAVTPAGAKVGKMMLGPSAGCVVRLWSDEAVSNGLVISEGLETGLVAATRIEHRGTRLAPLWAACSAGSMAKFPVLPGVESLTLLVDHDESGAGQRAAMECSARWTGAGREVVRLTPNAMGADFADIGRSAA